MGVVEGVGVLILSYHNQELSIMVFTLFLIFWMPVFILMSLTKPVKLNHFMPQPGLINREVLQSILMTVGVAVGLIINFDIFLCSRDVFKNTY